MVETTGNHNALVLETRREEKQNVLIIYEDKNAEKLVSYNEIRKVHEVNNDKGKEQLIHAYTNAGLICPEVMTRIKRVVNDCKICQKFMKSVCKPRVTLPKSTDFNQVVTMDLKQMGNKYILQIICSFTKFMQGKVIPNKKLDTIFDAMNAAWNYTVGFPSTGYFADNGGEFSNIKMDQLVSKF